MDFFSATNHNRLDLAVYRHLNVAMERKPKAAQDMLLISFGKKIGYNAAQECCLRLIKGGIEEQRWSFQLLPAYYAALEKQAPGVVVDSVTGD